MTLRENPYAGINAHLQSELQTEHKKIEGSVLASWKGFHAHHIISIAEALNEHLPTGYIARAEQSLQIAYENYEGRLEIQSPEPDVTVWKSGTGFPSPSTGAVASPTLVISHVEETLIELPPKLPKAILVFDPHKQPITRLELLSPANKPGGSYYREYMASRAAALLNTQALIEIDYLHETPAILPHLLGHYPEEANSYPYRIIISNPRQSPDVGQIFIYGFQVDMPIPIIGVPLMENEMMPFDFGAVYNSTFQRGRWGETLDYTRPPVRFETYSPDDQQRILKHIIRA